MSKPPHNTNSIAAFEVVWRFHACQRLLLDVLVDLQSREVFSWQQIAPSFDEQTRSEEGGDVFKDWIFALAVVVREGNMERGRFMAPVCERTTLLLITPVGYPDK